MPENVFYSICHESENSSVSVSTNRVMDAFRFEILPIRWALGFKRNMFSRSDF